MNKLLIVIAAILLSTLCFPSCNLCQSKDKKGKEVPDSTFLSETPYSELSLDSATLEKFIVKNKVRKDDADELQKFYSKRNYSFAWFDNNRMTEQVSHFMNMQKQYILDSHDSSLNNPLLDSLVAVHSTDTVFTTDKLPGITETELLLSQQFIIYTRKAYIGKEVNLHDLNWYIPRKKIDPESLLEAMTSKKNDSLSFREPLSMPYQLLRKELVKYYALQQKDTFTSIVLDVKKLQVNDSSDLIPRIRQKLFFLGYSAENNTSKVFDSTLYHAVVHFQNSHGLTPDGVIGKGFVYSFNVPIRDRVRQILINLERYRWLPSQQGGDFLVVNIPEFKLHVHQDGKYAWSTPVIVGKAATKTVIFTSELKYIVFAPYWNIPNSILVNEIRPRLRRDPGYLARNNMEWHNGSLRQRPGPNNSLGKIKFLFPNSYNIYLHDTPARSLFNETIRTFSHGCIRVKNPEKVAEFLLRNDPVWTPDSILHAMNRKTELQYTLPKTTPVIIGYFTAFIDANGELNFRDDIYGHDARLAEVLFSDKH